MTPRDARDATACALHRAGLSPAQLADLVLGDVHGRDGVLDRVAVPRGRRAPRVVTLDRIAVVALRVWVEHRGRRAGALFTSVACDNFVGARPLEPGELAAIVERGRSTRRCEAAAAIEPDNDAIEIDAKATQ